VNGWTGLRINGMESASRKMLLIALGCFGFVLLISIWALQLLPRNFAFLTWLLVCILIMIISIPFIKSWAERGSTDYMEIIYPLSLVFFANYALRTIYVLCNPFDPHVMLRPWLLDFHLCNITLFYLILGFGSLLLGYYSQIPQRLALALPKILHNEWPKEGALINISILYAFGILAIAYGFSIGFNPLIAVGEVRSVQKFPLLDYISNFSLYIVYAFFIGLITGAFKKSLAGRFLGLIMGGILLIRMLICGSKSGLLLFLLLFMLWYNYRHRRITLKPFVILALVLFFFIFPWINVNRNIYKSEYRAMGSSYQSFVDSAKLTYGNLRLLTLSEYLDNTFSMVASRQQAMDSFAAIISQTPRPNPYLLGYDFITIPCNLIPSFIWPGKPRPRDGEIFDSKYWHMSFRGHAGATFMGDLYMNFGLPGVIVGMFLTGIFIRFIYIYLVKLTGKSSPGVLYYMVFLMPLVSTIGEGEIGGLGYLLKVSVYYVLIVHMFMKVNLVRNY